MIQFPSSVCPPRARRTSSSPLPQNPAPLIHLKLDYCYVLASRTGADSQYAAKWEAAPTSLFYLSFFLSFPSPADDTSHSLMVFESAANVEECVSGGMPARKEARFDKRMRKHISHSVAVVFFTDVLL